MSDLSSFSDEYEQRIIDCITEYFFENQIDIIELIPIVNYTTIYKKSSLVLFSFSGTGISRNKNYLHEIQKIKQELDDIFPFFPEGELFFTIKLKKINILSYYIHSIKLWLLSKKIRIYK